MPFALYASSDYAALRQPDNWTFIAYDAQFSDMPQQRWLLDIAGQRAISCELSDISSHLAAARAGAGVAGLPCWRSLPRAAAAGTRRPAFSRDIWLVVHRDLRRSAPVRAVMDFVADTVAAQSGFSLGRPWPGIGNAPP